MSRPELFGRLGLRQTVDVEQRYRLPLADRKRRDRSAYPDCEFTGRD